MPIDYRFDDLDLREEPPCSARVALGPYTEGNPKTINCCSEYCATISC
ncbi:MAG: hypothetical protein QOI11_1209 [Candidatus Eremiobacteraeota bacterium]|jgi:hypothetical protein|nr:hypothetical protein [Candidatus Eremiobacteraeota bacterium]